MDLSHMMTAHLATATEDEKLRSLCDEQNKVGMQNCLSSETPLGRSSEPSSPGPLTITNVEELCKRLEKHKKELVDLVEGLIQHTEKGDKEGTWKFALAAVKELQLLPRANQPIDSLPIGKMTYEDVEKYFGLEPQRPLRGTSWEGPLPHIQLPQCAYQMLEIFDKFARRSVKNEAMIRCRLNNILFAVLDSVMTSAPDDTHPLNLQTETHLVSRPFQVGGKYCQAQGQCDYTVWYGEEVREQAINLVIVETKRPGHVSLGEGQALGYMAVVHQERKLSKRARNATVYGVATDGKTFYFLCINDESKWDRIVLDTAQLDAVVDLLAFIMKEAMTISPFTSRHTSKNASMEDDPLVLS
ncbi:hypothetical protein PEX2_006600 [Penicillium expansum]|uniref:Uncharacterized protein n=1 Tax=Penicillium expansum TaxID=27334 RepID=A0A0A2J8C7_PENEN|nr:hypothetical protein PEX2_006600 [Penicillium expansum]KAJ5498006.1 hypothetical protein N7453_007057 [Penicillium expansum]KGO44729.1 hypothetical protein PEXP_020010 [Penicillium expansum]KGO51584.1 hypothetical protein PEX2_006600 [Penicillium expansum]